MEGYIGTDKDCQSNVTLWMLWHDAFEQKCEGYSANRTNEVCHSDVCMTDGCGCERSWAGGFGKQ